MGRLWDAASGKEIAILKGHEDDVRTAEFSSDGLRVLTATRGSTLATSKKVGTARIWDAASGRVITVIEGKKSHILSAAFSPDGSRVVTGSADGTARILDAASGKEIAAMHEIKEMITAKFSPDGSRVVMQSSFLDSSELQCPDGSRAIMQSSLSDSMTGICPDGFKVVMVPSSSKSIAAIWRVFPTTRALINEAKRVLPHCLTGDQREMAFLDPAPPEWCIEMEKWPYHTQAWKDWLKFQRSNLNPPLPGTLQWKSWVAARSSDSTAPRLNPK